MNTNSQNDEIRMTNAEGTTKGRMRNMWRFQFVVQASSLIRHSTFVLRHFTVRVHMSRRRFSEGEFVFNT
jgi:hypothetical protein